MTSFTEVLMEEDLPPVADEDVSQHTEGVVQSYMNFRLAHDSICQPNDNIDEGSHFDSVLSDMHTGQSLAAVAEQLEQTNAGELEKLVQRVSNLTGPLASDDDWFTAFRIVVDGLTAGEFSWTKLVVVFCFAYRLLQKAWKNGWKTALGLISGALVRYLMQKKVMHWLAQHGGWLAANCLKLTQSMDLSSIAAVAFGTGIAAALLSFSLILLVKRKPIGPS